mmetsp:Transcript_87894/g.232627  ORF Transcript_87894/g.232627 Transcript_87894/m.232627 type:complete len:200 (+) Transcript_87894:686-1285(+)
MAQGMGKTNLMTLATSGPSWPVTEFSSSSCSCWDLRFSAFVFFFFFPAAAASAGSPSGSDPGAGISGAAGGPTALAAAAKMALVRNDEGPIGIGLSSCGVSASMTAALTVPAGTFRCSSTWLSLLATLCAFRHGGFRADASPAASGCTSAGRSGSVHGSWRPAAPSSAGVPPRPAPARARSTCGAARSTMGRVPATTRV